MEGIFMKRLFQTLCIIPVFWGSVYSSDIHVPGEYTTIQQAIDAAVDGDSVIVEPGTYEENVEFLGKQISVRSSQGAEVTIIDGGNAGSVVRFIESETSNTLLEGFTLSNGNGCLISNSTYGGGIYLGERCQPVLKSVIVADNQAQYGAGIYAKAASPTLDHCIISRNITDTWGAGIHCVNASDIKLIHCTISENESDHRGGGISSLDSSLLILNCIISLNKASRGGGIYSGPGDHQLVVVNSNVVLNYASELGSGLFCSSDALIINSIFWNISSSAEGEIHLHNSNNFDLTYSVSSVKPAP